MLIRSQDKKATTDDLNLHINDWDLEERYIIENSKMDNLGTYSTEEKAIKVLDMIQEEYLKCNKEHILGNFGFVQNKVFQMPQDSEV